MDPPEDETGPRSEENSALEGLGASSMSSMNLGEALTFLGRLGGPAASLLNGYVCVGGSLSYNGRVLIAGVGFELVWDLWNEQYSAFYFPIGGASLTKKLTASASIYAGVGWGFGNSFPVFRNVHAAWSGRFNSISSSVPIPGLNWGILGLSAGLTFFASPDFSIRGGAITCTLGADLAVLASATGALPLNLAGTSALYSPWDALTRLHAFNHPIHTLNGHAIVGLEAGVVGVANHMLRCLGSNQLLLSLGMYATAVSVVKSRAHGELRDAIQLMA